MKNGLVCSSTFHSSLFTFRYSRFTDLCSSVALFLSSPGGDPGRGLALPLLSYSPSAQTYRSKEPSFHAESFSQSTTLPTETELAKAQHSSPRRAKFTCRRRLDRLPHAQKQKTSDQPRG